MRADRVIVGLGFFCLLVAASSLLAGGSGFPWLSIASVVLAGVFLVVGLVRLRGRTHEDREPDPERGDRVTRVVFLGLCGLGAVTAAVAMLVAEGDARGHAIVHLATALVGLALFAAFGFGWHPRSGTGAATFRGVLLALLAVAVTGTFIESLGGAGYDAANSGRRIPLLTDLHDVGLMFGPAVLVAIPIALITGGVLILMWVVRKRHPLPAGS